MTEEERNTNTDITAPEVLDPIRKSDLHDLGFIGNPYTWTSNSHGTGKRKSRLDRALGNSEWLISYPDAKLVHLVQKGSTAFLFYDKLSNTRHLLSKWSKFTFGNINLRIASLQQELCQLPAADIQGNNTSAVLRIEKAIDDLLDIQASSNRQKPRDKFYNEIDRNSKYFHIRANQRRTRNNIDALQAQDGSWCQDRSSIEELLISHFSKISTSSNPTDSQLFLRHIPVCITSQENQELISIPSEAEIHQALMTMTHGLHRGQAVFHRAFIKHNGV
ncbi:uncharacterized protein LOC113316382 [Papaver somniferum]|uniref:uncharacterized protein LOC113316382 n=1 Tax=Papaver somniferum TaxID=3469 RepID=UPI000E702593|nr:uncharacterized protein LOC113316382 [Papaver somniferum]